MIRYNRDRYNQVRLYVLNVRKNPQRIFNVLAITFYWLFNPVFTRGHWIVFEIICFVKLTKSFLTHKKSDCKDPAVWHIFKLHWKTLDVITLKTKLLVFFKDKKLKYKKNRNFTLLNSFQKWLNELLKSRRPFLVWRLSSHMRNLEEAICYSELQGFKS